MKFQRIQDLRNDSDLSQKQISEILHISQRSYSHYETGSRGIPIEMLIRLADYYIPEGPRAQLIFQRRNAGRSGR